MMKIPSFRLYFPEPLRDEFMGHVREILSSGRLTLGPFTERFESEWARFIGVRHAIAVSSGTSALRVIYMLGYNVGARWASVPTNTFSATAMATYGTGINVHLRDGDEEDERDLGVVVHIGGYPAPFIKSKVVIEDACHAHGTVLDGKMLGSFGFASAFSFYPTKAMTTGEGGMICTNDEGLDAYARQMRDQGKRDFSGNDIVQPGFNARMTEISAAMGLCQLKALPEALRRRREVARIYDSVLGEHALPFDRGSCVPNYYKYIVLPHPLKGGGKGTEAKVKAREERKARLGERGISCSGEVYWPPLHMQPAYVLPEGERSFPASEDFCARHICLPIYPSMTEEEAEYVARNALEVLRE